MPTRLCSCGCGSAITRKYFKKKYPKSFIRGHQYKGILNHGWKGGRYKSNYNGVIYLLKHSHPNADKRGYVREHVFIMSEHLGRPIAQNEVIHHINGISDDNRLENLVLMTRQTHASHHHKGLIKPNSLKNLMYYNNSRAKAR